MKLMHIADLHLGKRVNEFSMLEDQAYILGKILELAKAERPAALLIAGDVYDKSAPSAEAVSLFDDFLAALAALELKVFVLAGNHDSPERLSFGGRLMDLRGVYMAPLYNGNVQPITLAQGDERVDVFMLPFLKPATARPFLPEACIVSYTDALRAAIDALPIDPARRSVLLAHQFVTGAARSESEDVVVGGLDNVDAAVFSPFAYVALGHLHIPQRVGRDTIRYAGSPLKYSFSEAGHDKSVTLIELPEAGDVQVRTLPLTPMRDMRELCGTYAELTLRENYIHTHREDFLRITLRDEQDVPNALAKLRTIYPNLLRLDYDNKRSRSAFTPDVMDARSKPPLTLLEEFYQMQNGQPMSREQTAYAAKCIARLWEAL